MTFTIFQMLGSVVTIAVMYRLYRVCASVRSGFQDAHAHDKFRRDSEDLIKMIRSAEALSGQQKAVS
jgi:hypothetical protein